MKKKLLIIVLLLALLSAPGLACQVGGGRTPAATQPLSESQPAQRVEASARPSESVEKSSGTEAPGALVAGQDVSVPVRKADQSPSSAGQPEPEQGGNPAQPASTQADPASALPLKVESQQVGKFHFLLAVENPNTGLAIEGTQYQVIGYDSQGGVQESNTADLGLIFPGERTMRLVGLNNTNGPEPERLELSLTKEGEARPSTQQGPVFSVEKATYHAGARELTAVIQNSSELTVNMPLLTVVAYDDQDQVISATTDQFTGFVPAGGHAAAKITFDPKAEPNRLEVYADIQGQWTLKQGVSGYQSLQVGQVMAARDDKGYTSIVFYVTNPNTDRALQGPAYQVAAYGPDGSVLGVDTGIIPMVFPGEKQVVISNPFSTPEGVEASTAEAQVIPAVEAFELGNYQSIGLEQNPLTASNSEFDGSYVKCTLHNAWKNAINLGTVKAVLLDAQGELMGFGTGSEYNLPADGDVEVKVYLVKRKDFTGVPATIELFPSVSSSTDIR